MNERIRGIMVEAGIEIKSRRPYIDEEPDGYLESDDDFMGNNHETIIMLLEEGGLEKFAELLIRKCSNIACNTDLEDVEGGDSAVLRAASNQIVQYFGVK